MYDMIQCIVRWIKINFYKVIKSIILRSLTSSIIAVKKASSIIWLSLYNNNYNNKIMNRGDAEHNLVILYD